MKRPRLRWWTIVGVCALVGIVSGVVIGFLAPLPARYEAEAQVAFLPAADLDVAVSSNYWEALSRGQVPRTAAIVYGDQRWLSSAAAAAGVPPSELTLKAGAVSDTTVVRITMQANSAASAEAALAAVLAKAMPDVSAISAPFVILPVQPPEGSAEYIAPKRNQILAITGLGGLLVGAGVGLLIARFATRRNTNMRAAEWEHRPVAQ